MEKVAGYKVRIRGSRRELIWKGSSTDEDEDGVGEEESGPPDMRIRASRRELVWDKKEERGGESEMEAHQLLLQSSPQHFGELPFRINIVLFKSTIPY